MMSSSGSSRIGRVDEPGERGPLELGQVLAGEVGDQVRGRIDGATIDRLHAPTLDAGRVSSPGTGARYALHMPVTRRDGEGDRETGPSWESLIERQIREAMEAGAFDELPHQGEPLPDDGDALAGNMAMANRMLRSAGYAPPWIEADKVVRALLARRDLLLARATRVDAADRPRVRAEFERVVGEANRAIVHLNAEAPTDRQHRVLLDPSEESRRLQRAFEGAR